jgi:hypothetical protein
MPSQDEGLRRMTRLPHTAAIVLSCAVLSTCGTVDPPLGLADFQAREDCLYETTCRLLGEQGTETGELQGIATSSTAICSAPLWHKMLGQAGNRTGTQAMNDGLADEETDRVRTESRALSIALEQSNTCEVQPAEQPANR